MECQDWVSITCPSVVHNTSVWSQDNWWYANCSSVLSYAWPKRKKTDDTLHVSIKRRSCWNNVKSAWATISWICKHIPRRLSTSTKLPERSLVTAGIYRHWKKAKEETATYDIYIYRRLRVLPEPTKMETKRITRIPSPDSVNDKN